MYNDSDIIVPGEEIKWEGKIIGSYYKENGKIFAKYVSTVRVSENILRIIPLQKVYIPKPSDYVIGIVKELIPVGWELDINSPYRGILSLRELSDKPLNPLEIDVSKLLREGEIVFAKVKGVSKLGTATLTLKDEKTKKLKGGILIKINPAKVARVIGKGGSLIKLFKEYAKVNVIVGQNGFIYLKGPTENVEFVVELIKHVEKYSHKTGLTDWVKEQLEKKFG